MSTITACPTEAGDARADDPTVAAACARLLSQRVRGGDMGALPAVLGLIVLIIVFSIARPSVLHRRQLRQPVHPGRRGHVIAMGLVFVLLLGEIDLSAGFTSGSAPRCWPCC